MNTFNGRPRFCKFSLTIYSQCFVYA
uniref:Uncharacterized protein n=1 Tax=Anguilla anguilla TaxID=7936 RepID=A0A0E9VZX3_ANGAN